MRAFPVLVDAEEAIEYYGKHECTDAEKAYVIGILSKAGYGNKDIRDSLDIDKAYTVTHFRLAGKRLSDIEMMLWHKNPTRITLGHVRAIAKFKEERRMDLLRDLLVKRIPVYVYEKLAKGDESHRTADIKLYEKQMSEKIGRPVKINYNASKASGSLILNFYGLGDLEDIAMALGFESEDDF